MIDVVTYSAAKDWVKKNFGINASLIKSVTNGDTMPTAREGGAALIVGDFVMAKSTSTFPFTTSDGKATFSSAKDTAVWSGVEWLMNAHTFQRTNEVTLIDKTTESLSGTSNYQSEVNAEFKAAIENKHFVYEQATAAAVWNVTHNMAAYPCVTVLDSAGNTCIGQIEYIDTNNIKLTFNAAFSGKAYLS